MSSPNASVIEVTDATFQRDVIERSRQVPVVVDFWAPWCGPCRMIGPVLEKLAGEARGAWILAKLNTDENPEVSRAFHISGIPAVKAFRKGSVAAEFVGAVPERQIRDFLDQLLPSECETLATEGEKKRKAGRFEEAEGAFSKALAKDRGCPPAVLGLARLRVDQGRTREATSLLDEVPPGTPERAEADRLAARLRVQAAGSVDTAALRQQVDRDPDDLDSRYALAMALAASEQYEEALPHFLDIVARDQGRKKEAARKSVLDILQLLGPDHPLSATFRAKLASALYR